MDPAEYEGRVSDIRRDVQLFKRKHGLEQGKDYSELNDDQLTDDYHYTIFPNVSMNVHADDVMMFRQRPHPTNPDKMFYDVWLFELVPDGEEWQEDRKSVVQGKSVSVRVDLGGRRIIKKKMRDGEE